MLKKLLYVLWVISWGSLAGWPVVALPQPIVLPTGAPTLLDSSLDLSSQTQIWVPTEPQPFAASRLAAQPFGYQPGWDRLFDGQDRPEQFWAYLQLDGSQLVHNRTWLMAWNTYEFTAYFRSGLRWDSLRSGNLVPISERPLGEAYGSIPFLPLTIPAGDTLEVYLKIWPGQVRVHDRLEWAHAQLMTTRHYLNYDRRHRMLDMLALGMFLAVAFYNLVIYFHTWRRPYLLLSVFSLVLLLFLMNLRDYTLEVFWPDWPRWNYTVFTMLIGLSVFWSFVRFTQKFLDTQLYVPLRHRLLNVMIGLNLAVVGLRLYAEFLHPEWHAANHPLLATITRTYWVLMVLAAVFAAAGCYRHRPRGVRRYLLINSVMILMALLRLLYTNELISVTISMDLLTFTAAVQQISFALALADHIRDTDREREAAEAEVYLERAHAEKLEALDQAKTRLYTNLTHEFRTPLTLITGLSQDLQTSEKQPRMGEKLAIIERNGQQLLALVNQMLDLAKAESGQLTLNPQQGDLAQYLAFLTQSFQAVAEERKIRLQCVADPPTLLADYDPLRLQQVMSNLLSNALKFTPAEGKVSVLLQQKEGKVIEVLVSDTGEGIAPEHLQQIFDRFYQVPSRQQPGGGTGIGLALVKELVHLMDGRVTVASEVGKGTQFRLRLPLTRQAPLAEVEPLAPVSPLPHLPPPPTAVRLAKGPEDEQGQVLIVEDNADVRYYLRECLRGQYQVLEARDGVEGLALAQEHIPDLIVTDLMMPHMDGQQLLQALGQDPRTDHIPVVVLTAKDDDATRLDSYKGGAHAFLLKPFEREELMVRLQQLLAYRQRLQQRLQAEGGDDEPTMPSSDPQEAFLQQLRQHIRQHLGDENFDTTQLSRHLGMSRAQLHRKVKGITGESPGRLLRQMRLEQARKLLQQNDLQIAEVAYQVGFSDPAYFTRVFRDYYQQTPSAMREKQ